VWKSDLSNSLYGDDGKMMEQVAGITTILEKALTDSITSVSSMLSGLDVEGDDMACINSESPSGGSSSSSKVGEDLVGRLSRVLALGQQLCGGGL